MYPNLINLSSDLSSEVKTKYDWTIGRQTLSNFPENTNDEQANREAVSKIETRKASQEQSNLKSELASLNKQMAALYLQVEGLKETIKEVRQELKYVEFCQHEARLTFEINEAKAFIESGEVRQSAKFYCRGIAWYLTASTTRVNGQPESLSVHLHHGKKGQKFWFIATWFSISVLNETPGGCNKTKKRCGMWFTRNTTSHGFRKFTAVEKLTNRGFLKNDRLRLHVYLYAKERYTLFG